MRKLALAAAGALMVLGATACQPTSTTPTTTTTTTAPRTNARPVQMDVSFTHGCAAYHDGTVRCWGNNRNGQLGNGTATGVNGQTNAVQVTGIHDAVEVSVGDYFSCARRSTGWIACWGLNSHGQLGNGTTTQSAVPVTVSGITTATSLGVTQGTFPSGCASLANGTVRCWGSNLTGTLGTDDIPSTQADHTTTPVAVEGVTDAVQVSAGRSFVCARRSGGGAACWGDNQSGELGDPSVPDGLDPGSSSTKKSVLPVQVQGLAGATTISAGNGHVCAQTAAGTECWGSNWTGQMGNGSVANIQQPPSLVTGGHTFSAINAGATSCGIEGTTAWCWGPDMNGQIGNPNVPAAPTDGSMRPKFTTVPLQVTAVTQPVKAIASGEYVTCAALQDRSVRCWGTTPNGSQLGAPAPY